MATFEIDDHNSIFYIHHEPAREDGLTWVFFNALTGDTQMWERKIAPHLRAEGHGTLSFNYRGQANSTFSPSSILDASLIIDDTRSLLAQLRPQRPLLCGLSIGGLFAAQSWLAGFPNLKTEGMVLINTLRRDGDRLRWINDALVRCTEIGGLQLFRDLFVPLLFNQEWQANNRDLFLTSSPYQPLEQSDGHYNLLKHAGTADWNLPYEQLKLPVLVVTGLQDHVFLDLEDVSELSARLPDSRHIKMANAGHMIPAERPAQLNEILRHFAGEIGS